MSRPSLWTFLQRGGEQLREHGPSLLWWRYIRRQHILRLPPLPCPPEADLEVHMQVCARDWLNGHWSVRSLARFTNRPFRLVLLDDGALPAEAYDHYRRCFPGVILPRRDVTEKRLHDILGTIAPTLLELWRGGKCFTLPKVLDSAVNTLRPSIVQLDPDVLFFASPEELLAGLESPSHASLWNARREVNHADGMFTHTPSEVFSLTGLQLPVPFAIGLGVWSPSAMPWAHAETLVAALPPPDHLRFMLDQTLLGLHAAVHGWSALSTDRYAVEPVPNLNGVVARHYFSKTRDLMYVEGMPALVRQGLLASRQFRR